MNLARFVNIYRSFWFEQNVNQDEGDAKQGEGEYEVDAKGMQRLSTGHAIEL